MTIFWFRRDLRLLDNCGLFYALQCENVLPIFIFDKNILEDLPKDDARVTFIHGLLKKMHTEIPKSGLAVFHDTPEKVFEELVKKYKVSAVYCNSDYEPYAITRDKSVEAILKKHNVPFHAFKDQVIFEKDEIVKDDGTPYVVYTPFSKRWLENFKPEMTDALPSEKFLDRIVAHNETFLSLDDIGFKKSEVEIPEYDVSKGMIDKYAQTRNLPSDDATSHLSPHLRFGSVSIREMVKKADASTDKTFLKELIWREFFMSILWHFPQTVTKSFRPEYDTIKWRNNESEFKAWCNGQTGYPMVDAGMRQLNATGRMHNRVRMVVASFLCKHLLIDWRWGEAYFAQKLLDYEQSSNIGNWQWAAGSGVDAAPYFRIFNPAEQQKKFDPKGEYCRRWIPELDLLDYPQPIVDHKEARERCLIAYKKALR